MWFWYCHASWDTVTDIVIFLMPIPQIATLNLPKMQKIGLILVFLTGALYDSLNSSQIAADEHSVLFTSIMRMIALSPSGRTLDPTWGSTPAWLWTVIELNTSIIVCCLPALRAPVLGMYYKWRPVTKSPSCGLRGMSSMQRKSRAPNAWELQYSPTTEMFEDRARWKSLDRIVKTTDISIDFESVSSKELVHECAGTAA